MISQVNNMLVSNTYSSNNEKSKDTTKTSGANVSKQGDTSKVQQIKEALNSGDYKINLQALSKKIAEELM